MNASLTVQENHRLARPFRSEVPVAPRCPSCQRKFRYIRAGEATVVAKRTCPGCGEVWQIVVRFLATNHSYGTYWIHKCVLSFLRHTRGFGLLGDQRKEI